MADTVTLVGLDFGTTTSSAVVATAELIRGAVGGRTELTDFRERFHSEMVFTPLLESSQQTAPQQPDHLDLAALSQHLDTWLSTAGVDRHNLFGGGALLTGLTAEKRNARGLVDLVRKRVGNVLVAAAADPCLESWLSFMGSCGELSRALPDVPILNLDIGGGTTNSAVGLAGQVVATGCCFLGARHFQFTPGTYRLTGISHYGRALLAHLAIDRTVGDELTEPERATIIDAYVQLLTDLVAGRPLAAALRVTHEQVPLAWPAVRGDVAVTFSGGVGELVYRRLAGLPPPSTTTFGDLGIDLAERLAELALAEPERYRLRPASVGRATAFGLLRHTTEISGSTLYLPQPELLPLSDIPILGRIGTASDATALRAALDLARRSESGAALQVALVGRTAAELRDFGTRLAAVLREMPFPAALPLVLLVRENIGKTLGQYITEWGALPLRLIVVDEVAPRDAQYLQLGRQRSQVVPVSFYGLRPPEIPT